MLCVISISENYKQNSNMEVHSLCITSSSLFHGFFDFQSWIYSHISCLFTLRIDWCSFADNCMQCYNWIQKVSYMGFFKLWKWNMIPENLNDQFFCKISRNQCIWCLFYRFNRETVPVWLVSFVAVFCPACFASQTINDK